MQQWKTLIREAIEELTQELSKDPEITQEIIHGDPQWRRFFDERISQKTNSFFLKFHNSHLVDFNHHIRKSGLSQTDFRARVLENLRSALKEFCSENQEAIEMKKDSLSDAPDSMTELSKVLRETDEKKIEKRFKESGLNYRKIKKGAIEADIWNNSALEKEETHEKYPPIPFR